MLNTYSFSSWLMNEQVFSLHGFGKTELLCFMEAFVNCFVLCVDNRYDVNCKILFVNGNG